MNTLIVAVAQYALFLVALGGLFAWWRVDRATKVALAVQVVVGLALMAVLVKVAGVVHTDPRPFVANPSLHPMFSHPPDNGFPSDHTALAATVSLIVLRYRRALGVVLLIITVAIGAARVAAHVHHVQDIAAGLVIGVLAAGLAVAAWEAWQRMRSRETGVRSENVPG